VYWSLTSTERQNFLESLSKLGQSELTELRVLKLGADLELGPGIRWSSSYHPPFHYYSGRQPNFTVHHGDIGLVNGLTESEDIFEAIWECNEPGTDFRYVAGRAYSSDWSSYPSICPGYCSWVVSGSSIQDVVEISFEPCDEWPAWGDFMQRSKLISTERDIELHEFLICVWPYYRVSISGPSFMTRLAPDGSPTIDSLYFHRKPDSRSSPLEFWGFFSTNPDPRAPPIGHDKCDGFLNYDIQFRTWRAGHDWNREYQKVLKSGLATMPGSYPEASIEELSDDELE